MSEAPSEITILPVPAATFSLKVRTILSLMLTSAASSLGVAEASVGAVVSGAASVVKFSVVASGMPA